jgi:hypothetical protein
VDYRTGVPEWLQQLYGTVDELGKGFAFEFAGSQESYVNELFETLILTGKSIDGLYNRLFLGIGRSGGVRRIRDIRFIGGIRGVLFHLLGGHFGYEFLKGAGKNPWAMAMSFEKLQSISASGGRQRAIVNNLFSSHPDVAARIERMSARATQEGYKRPSK